MKQFLEEKGEKVFLEANKYYNDKYVSWLKRAKKNKEFMALTNDQKIDTLRKHRAKFKKETFREYDFRPRREKPERLPNIE